jgi:hypothetical protein
LRDVDEQWELITYEIEELLTTEKKTKYKIGRDHRLDNKNPFVVGVKFVYGVSGGGLLIDRGPILVGIREMKISLGDDDGVPTFEITEGTYRNLEETNEGTSLSAVRSLVENKQIYNVGTTAKLITKRVKNVFGIND